MKILYGAQFYRPPNPPYKERKKDLRVIAKELKFNVIKIWAMWNWCNPEERVYELSELEEIILESEKLGLKVVVNTILENAPYWLDERYPEARYVDATGRAVPLGGNSNTQSGGHPGLCFDHPGVIKAAEDYLAHLAGSLGKYDSMFAWDCWNEPHVEPVWSTNFWANQGMKIFCYCPSSRVEFIRYLKAKYKDDLDMLNKAWVRRFGKWSHVSPPERHGTYADWLDWRRFTMENLSRHMKFRYDCLKKFDPEHPVMSHAGRTPPMDPGSELGIDMWKLSAPLDKWGLSLFPKWFDVNPCHLAMSLDITRSSAEGKDFWISELQGGHSQDKGLQGSRDVVPDDIRLWNWLGVSSGAKAIIYWCYRTEMTSTEATGFGLVRRDGKITERAREASDNFALFKRYSDLLTEYLPEEEVAILFNPDNGILNYAMEGNEEALTSSYRGYYRAVWEADLFARFIKPEGLEGLKQKILIAPFPLLCNEETAKGIRKFVERGGTLISEASFGLFDANGVCNEKMPYGMDEVFGLREGELSYAFPAKYGCRNPYMQGTFPLRTKVETRLFTVPLELITAKPIGWHKESILAAHNHFGKGETYYFGTSIGRSIYCGDPGAKEVIKAILRTRCPPGISGAQLRPRLISNKKQTLLVIVNEYDRKITEPLTLPPGKWSGCLNIHQERRSVIKGRKIRVTVSPRNVIVLELF